MSAGAAHERTSYCLRLMPNTYNLLKLNTNQFEEEGRYVLVVQMHNGNGTTDVDGKFPTFSVRSLYLCFIHLKHIESSGLA